MKNAQSAAGLRRERGVVSDRAACREQRHGSFVALDPLGVVLAIMPWNYPFWQLVRFAAPALAAGNGIAIKHAGNVQQCAAAFVAALEDAGAPSGLACNLRVETGAVGGIIADPRIAAVTLTGSTDVGRIVAAQAGQALKKQVLELGGSDPFIVLADADIELAAKTAVKARFQNAGQSCISAKRFIVEDKVADAFVAAYARALRRWSSAIQCVQKQPWVRWRG